MADTTPKHEVQGIMTYLRGHTHIILFLLIFSFAGLIVFEWGMDVLGIRSPGQTNVIAKVNGKEISYQDYLQRVQNQYVMLRQQLGIEPDEQYMEIVRSQVLDEMINEILVSGATADMGLFATDEEIKQEVLYRPRPEFLSSPDFLKEDGTFDIAKYQSLLAQLAQVNSSDLLILEEYARLSIPQIKLEHLITATLRVTEEEVIQAFLEEQQTAAVEYALAEGSRFADFPIDLTEQEITEYYAAHEENFIENETRELRYVIFDTSPTSSDSAAVDSNIEEALKRASAGEDFAGLSLEYTDSDGDLGTFGKGTMFDEFENVVFADNVEAGSILGPVETSLGKHIIKIERLVKNKNGEIDSVQAKQILFTYEARPSTLDNVESDADYFSIAAQEVGFDSAAVQVGVTVFETIPFSRYGFIPGFGTVPEIENFAFRSEFEPKNPPVSDAMELPMGFAVFQLAAVNEERVKSLEDTGVRFEIEQILRVQKQIQYAQSLMERVRSDIESGTPFREAAEKEDLEVITVDSIKVNDYITDIGYDIKFASAAFGLDPGNVSNPVTGNNGVYLIRLIKKDPFDEELYLERRSEIAARIIQQKRQSAFSSWLQQLRNSADIEDYRAQFYIR